MRGIKNKFRVEYKLFSLLLTFQNAAIMFAKPRSELRL